MKHFRCRRRRRRRRRYISGTQNVNCIVYAIWLTLYNGAHSIGIFKLTLARLCWCRHCCRSIAFRCCKHSFFYIHKLYMSAMLCITSSELQIRFSLLCVLCTVYIVHSRFDYIFSISVAIAYRTDHICICTTLYVRIDFNSRLPLLQQANVFAYLGCSLLLLYVHCTLWFSQLRKRHTTQFEMVLFLLYHAHNHTYAFAHSFAQMLFFTRSHYI